MKAKNIIYEQLEQLLFSLGFTPIETKGNYKVYEHFGCDALMILPDYQPTDKLDNTYYLAVRRTLKEYDLMDESTFEKWFN